MGPIEKELTERLFVLVGKGRKWVMGSPLRKGEACAAWDAQNIRAVFSLETMVWFNDFTNDYTGNYHMQPVARFNDSHSREERIWWFQEAIAAAHEEGI